MKNATRIHEPEIVDFLLNEGCSSIRFEKGSLVALRPARDGRLRPLSIDVYEDDDPATPPGLRFRARVARRYGLPVSSHHGDSVCGALAAVQWETLARPSVASQPPPLAGVL